MQQLEIVTTTQVEYVKSMEGVKEDPTIRDEQNRSKNDINDISS